MKIRLFACFVLSSRNCFHLSNIAININIFFLFVGNFSFFKKVWLFNFFVPISIFCFYGKIKLTYLLTRLLTYLLTYLHTHLLTYLPLLLLSIFLSVKPQYAEVQNKNTNLELSYIFTTKYSKNLEVNFHCFFEK